MENLYRKIGTNIYTLMRKAELDPETMAEQLEYSIKDMWNIIEGKVMLPPLEIEKIASMLNTTKDSLIRFKSDSLAPNLEFMNDFSNPDNLDKVLDLMDEYVELSEAVM